MKKEKYRFFVDKECNWFQDGKPITHKGIYKFNYQCLKVNKDNEFYLKEGSSIAYVKFEDKPFFIKRADIITDKKIILLLNDFSEEELDINGLYFKKNIPYCNVKKGLFQARFSRPALYQISKIIDIVNDNYYIGELLIKRQ
tara:strand:+ start:107 stop:532 length:426 start_codon:yes stop_codon:yes gene_type:complete